MKILKTGGVHLLAVLAMLVLMPSAQALELSFDTPVVTGASQAAGVWYVDRYAPAGFGTVLFDGGNRLQESIAAADGLNNRPSTYSGTFYNTQGRKFDLDSTTTAMSVDLYVDASWASTGRRMAGFWGTAFDAGAAVSAYSTLEFTSDSTGARFRAWSNDGWLDLGLPDSFSYNSWTTLSVALVGSNLVYTVGDLSLSVDSGGSSYFGNSMLQGHNTATGVSYDIYWDNLVAVPEPAGWATMGAGLVCVLWMVRRRLRAR